MLTAFMPRWEIPFADDAVSQLAIAWVSRFTTDQPTIKDGEDNVSTGGNTLCGSGVSDSIKEWHDKTRKNFTTVTDQHEWGCFWMRSTCLMITWTRTLTKTVLCCCNDMCTRFKSSYYYHANPILSPNDFKLIAPWLSSIVADKKNRSNLWWLMVLSCSRNQQEFFCSDYCLLFDTLWFSRGIHAFLWHQYISSSNHIILHTFL